MPAIQPKKTLTDKEYTKLIERNDDNPTLWLWLAAKAYKYNDQTTIPSYEAKLKQLGIKL